MARKNFKGRCDICGFEKYVPHGKKSANDYILHFGKYKSKKITEVPISYLKWLIEKDVVGGGIAWTIVEILKDKNIDFKSYRNV
jgi:uncharacterized protein (DUF3820 family)